MPVLPQLLSNATDSLHLQLCHLIPSARSLLPLSLPVLLHLYVIASTFRLPLPLFLLYPLSLEREVPISVGLSLSLSLAARGGAMILTVEQRIFQTKERRYEGISIVQYYIVQ